MSQVHERGPARMEANLTPMIDVTFLLIVFFVLVSQIVEVENVDLRLPELEEPATAIQGEELRAVINVVPGLGGAATAYRLGATSYPVGPKGVEGLTGHLAGLMQITPALRVNLRADRFTDYRYVQPVLEAVSVAAGRVEGANATPRINLVVVRED